MQKMILSPGLQSSPLIRAILNKRDEETIQILLENGANANEVSTFGNTPLLLHLRSDNCSSDIVKLLLHYNADINCLNYNGESPLTTALKYRRCEMIIRMLLEKGANANIVVEFYQTPLLLYLGRYFNDNCNIVKLLIQFNADVNFTNSYGVAPLTTAIHFSRSEAIISMLLEAGAGIDTLNRFRKSPLCIAFKRCSNDTIKLLLDAGASPNACKYHRSALHCATDESYSRLNLREDILKLLLRTNVEVNSVDTDGQSVLCFALQHGAKASDIQLLLDAGLSLNACVKHSSPLFCATGICCLNKHVLRKDMVQFLLDNGACVKDEGLELLQCALGCKYETGAIRLLLDLPGMDDYVVTDKTLLHDAVWNPSCKVNVIKLLVDRKAQVLSKNKMGETPLHRAVRGMCDPSVISLLLKNGAQVNAKNKLGETPLTLAVNHPCFTSVLRELLLAGARIGKTKFNCGCGNKCDLLRLIVHKRMDCTDEYNKTLVKFFLLQNPKFDARNFQRAHAVRNPSFIKLKKFLNECLSELSKMDSLQIGRGRTFRMFVTNIDCTKINYDVNQILGFLMKNTFPVFFDVISARMDRSRMETELKKLQVYGNKIHPGGKVYLNCDIWCKIYKYLPSEALLNFILAFRKPVNRNDIGEASKNNIVLRKRKSVVTTEVLKHQKLRH